MFKTTLRDEVLKEARRPVRKPYTAWRRFLAWVGFVAIFAGVPAIVWFVMWANAFINANV